MVEKGRSEGMRTKCAPDDIENFESKQSNSLVIGFSSDGLFASADEVFQL